MCLIFDIHFFCFNIDGNPTKVFMRGLGWWLCYVYIDAARAHRDQAAQRSPVPEAVAAVVLYIYVYVWIL